MPSLPALLAFLAPYRKALVAALGTVAVAGVAELGPHGAVIIPALLTIAGVFLTPNLRPTDENGDGEIDVAEFVHGVVGKALDEYLARQGVTAAADGQGDELLAEFVEHWAAQPDDADTDSLPKAPAGV